MGVVTVLPQQPAAQLQYQGQSQDSSSSRSSPFDRLPPEIIGLIFLYGQLTDGFHCHARTPFEITASHVSRRWRGIATECCRNLWCSVLADASCPLDRVLAYLRRSWDLPLRISYDHAGDGRDEVVQALIILQHLLPHLARTKSLRMRISDRALTSALPALVGLDVPLLEHCSISLWDADSLSRTNDAQFIPCIFKGGEGAPRLSLVHLSGCKVIVACCPSLTHLTTLHLHHYSDEDEYPSMTYQYFRSMISAAPQLERLSMHGEIVIDWPAGAGQDLTSKLVTAPHLHFLAVQFIPVPSFAFYFFRVLRAPALHEVALVSVGDEDIMHAALDTDSDTASGAEALVLPSVRTLLLASSRLSSRIVPRLARVFPGITELRVQERFASDLARSLSYSNTWPNLHTLNVSRLQRLPKHGALLFSSLAMRRRCTLGGKPIHTLILDSENLLSQEYVEALRGELGTLTIVPEEDPGCGRLWWEMTREKPWWMVRTHDPFWARCVE